MERGHTFLNKKHSFCVKECPHNIAKFSGGNNEKATPVPIPNTAVKLLSADDTWAYALGK